MKDSGHIGTLFGPSAPVCVPPCLSRWWTSLDSRRICTALHPSESSRGVSGSRFPQISFHICDSPTFQAPHAVCSVSLGCELSWILVHNHHWGIEAWKMSNLDSEILANNQYLSSVWDFLCWVNPLLCVKVLSQTLQWNLSPTWFLLCLLSCSWVGNFASHREHGRLGVCWQWASCLRWLPGFRNFLPHFEQSKAAVLSWWTSMWFARVLAAANSLRQIGHLKGRTPLLQTTYT